MRAADTVTVIGANGLVGSAFARHLSGLGLEVTPVTRETYASLAGTPSDVVIDAAGNSRKYLADDDPAEDFDRSVAHRLRTLRDFPARLHLHVSSVDVYPRLSDPSATSEDAPFDPRGASRYGFHKLLAEHYVRFAAERWLIVRLAGMVGPGLRKNPVFDIVNRRPLRIHPGSRYQFMRTEDIARMVWGLVTSGHEGEIFNVCGDGLISPREIGELAGVPLDLSCLPPDASPRVVHVDNRKLARHEPIPTTRSAIESFLQEAAAR